MGEKETADELPGGRRAEEAIERPGPARPGGVGPATPGGIAAPGGGGGGQGAAALAGGQAGRSTYNQKANESGREMAQGAAEATTVKSSKSNSSERLTADPGDPAVAAEATNLNSSKSNTARDAGPGTDAAGEAARAANLNSSRSNRGMAPGAGEDAAGRAWQADTVPPDTSAAQTGGVALDGGGANEAAVNASHSNIEGLRPAGEDGGDTGDAGADARVAKTRSNIQNNREMAPDEAGGEAESGLVKSKSNITNNREMAPDAGGAPEAAINTSHSNIKHLSATGEDDWDPDGAAAINNSKSNIKDRLGAPPDGPDAAADTSMNSIRNMRD